MGNRSLLCAMAFLAIASAGCNSGENLSHTKIVGGRLADDHRFMAGLIFDGSSSPSCGGAFLAPRVVITAAHCVSELTHPLRIRPGSNNKNPAASPLIKVQAIIPHPNYNKKQMQNDIAILLLEEYDPAVLPTPIEPIAYNHDPEFPAENGSSIVLTAIGRGNTSSFGDLYEDLVRQVDLNIVPLDLCQKRYGADMITSSNLCAGNYILGGVDSCQGDSGGPLIASINNKPQLVGVVSWGENCAQPESPGVYARVSSYVAWIEAQIAAFTPPHDQPIGEPTSEQITTYLPARCSTHKALAKTRHFGSGTQTGHLSEYLMPATHFEPAVTEPSNANACTMYLPGGLPLKASLLAAAAGDKILIKGENRTWQADTKLASTDLSLTCAKQTLTHITYNSAQGYSVIYLNGRVFMGVPTNTLIDPSKLALACQVDEFTLEVATKGDENSSSPQWARLKNTALSSETIFTLQPVEATEKSPKASLILDESINIAKIQAGTHTLLNQTDTHIFTWALTCSFPFTLIDKIGGTYPSISEDEGENTIKFIYPTHSHGAFRQKETKSFKIQIPQGVDESSTCSINGLPLSLNAKTKARSQSYF